MNSLKVNLFIFIRRSVYFSLYFLDKVIRRRNNLFILCYHSISSDNWLHSVKFSELKKQIELLKKSGYEFVDLNQLYMHIKGIRKITKPSVILTIDDGYSDILQTVNFFKNEGINPGLFLVTNIKKVNRAEMDSRKRLLTISELNILRNNGWIIGAHGATHSNLTRVSSYHLKDETYGAKRILEKNLKSQIDFFAFPFGAYNKSALREVKKSGYRLAFTMDDKLFNGKINNLQIPRIGVNNTHSIAEFKTIYSPSVIAFRGFVKRILS